MSSGLIHPSFTENEKTDPNNVPQFSIQPDSKLADNRNDESIGDETRVSLLFGQTFRREIEEEDRNMVVRTSNMLQELK